MKWVILLFIATSIISFKFILLDKWKQTRIAAKRYLELVESSKDIIYYYELKPTSKFLYLSPSIEHYLGKGIVAKSYRNPSTPFELIHPDDYKILESKVNGELDYSQTVIQRWKNDKGTYCWFEEYATPIYQNGEVKAVQGIMRNIDEKVKLQQELEYRSTHDALTGIYNRYYFEKIINRYDLNINKPIAIIVCDLDDLKYMNDNYGHKKGDELILNTATFLKNFSGYKQTVARIGGDEFAIILADLDKVTAQQTYQKLGGEIIKYNEDNHTPINISIGFSFTEHSLGKMEKLFNEADKRMYENKQFKKSISISV
ncbi:sensor domain-containing diguanylate cyclase [Bacillus sp. FJAT-45037]|uniref:sensor domain-containing diguanylate cyclase n=1 Tax=Bacillus sp. FJAT-45037 TaxID=2011007 RepID=UPI000C24E2BA|nr:diguanylate cyclase [Bacillus sp. FJAT-45037]